MSVVITSLFAFVVVIALCSCCAATKTCTNVLPQSHTFRYNFSTSSNETWKEEFMSHYHHSTQTEDHDVWKDLLPRKRLMEEEEQMMLMNKKINGVVKPPQGFLKEVSLHDVRLNQGSIHAQAQQTNLEYLLMLDVDRLLWSFRKTAGLPTLGKPHGGWEDPEVELRGHFIGHYMSASALMWASTHNDTLKKRMTAIVANLSICQEKIGTGYLAAFPSFYFDKLEALENVWAPYYTIHKILAGLLDQHSIAGNTQALKVAIRMVEYFYNRVQNVIRKYTISRHYSSLNEESGGLNDVLYRLYAITKNPRHLWLAHLFDKPCFLGELAVEADDIGDFHANTHIPVVVGSQMRYEVTGDPLYKEIATFFMDLVNSSHTYATGGTSVHEFWKRPQRMVDSLETPENQETCTTYNMLKVSRNLFRWTKKVSHADYYERALTNGILSIQRGKEPGVMIYMFPQGRGVSKAKSFHGWGTKFDSFWCCYGTGIESFSKLGDSIYFEEEGENPTLYVIQYIPSLFKWNSGKVTIDQRATPAVSWDPFLRVSFTFSPNQQTATWSTINFRIPTWTHKDGAKGILNNETISLPSPGNFLSIKRKWNAGDKLTLQLPMLLKTEAIKDDRSKYASIQAILYGPYLLAGHSTGDWDIKAAPNASMSEWIKPVPSSYNNQLFYFSQDYEANSTFVLTNSEQSFAMQKLPEPGTEVALHATFRVIRRKSSSKLSTLRDAIGELVMLEPIDHPGMRMIVQEKERPLNMSSSSVSMSSSALFLVVPGLDGRKETISLASQRHDGCFVLSGRYHGNGVRLRCFYNTDPRFNREASFIARRGLAEYNPISFVAKGLNRNFLLEPLHAFRDEHYTVYFNLKD